MSNKLSYLAMAGACALFCSGVNDIYNSDKDYYSSGVDLKSINKARRLSRRSKSVNRSRKKR